MIAFLMEWADRNEGVEGGKEVVDGELLVRCLEERC